MKLQFLGHACFHLETDEGQVIFDPYLSGNPQAAMGPETVKADGILVSHGHSDHLGDAIAISRRLGAPIIAPFELATYCAQRGAKIHPMHIGGAHRFPFGWVKLTPAWHGSAVIEGKNIIPTGNPCGFLVQMSGQTAYFAGDTGLFGDMKLLGDAHEIDVAMLPIGDNFVMGIEDAVKAARLLQPRVVVPMHYNTFDLIRQDPRDFARRLESLQIECRILQPGETTEI